MFSFRPSFQGALYTYDITSSSSYEEVKCSLRHLRDIFPNYDIVIVLLGIIEDCELDFERAVTTDEAKEFASMYQSVCTYPCCVYTIATDTMKCVLNLYTDIRMHF